MRNFFLLDFQKPEDAVAILCNGPWPFSGQAIVMAFIKKGDLSTLMFDFMGFWVFLLDAQFKGSPKPWLR